MLKPINILIADIQPIFREGLRSVIQKRVPIRSIFQAESQKEVLKLLSENKIDILIMDVFLSDCNSLKLGHSLLNNGFKGILIFLTFQSLSHYSKLASQIGASACLSKNAQSDMVVDAIVSTVKGFRVFKSGMSEHYPTLSVREQMVFDYLALGYSNQQIARTLSLSEKTISTYKSRILQKYDTKSIVELVNLMHLA